MKPIDNLFVKTGNKDTAKKNVFMVGTFSLSEIFIGGIGLPGFIH